MFEIELNHNVKSRLLKIEKDKSCANCHNELTTFLKNGSMPTGALLEYYNKYWKHDIPLKQLLIPLNMKFEAKYIPGSNYSSEFKKHLEELRVQRQEVDYQSLIKKRQLKDQIIGDTNDGDEITFAAMNKAIKEQVTTVFNVLVTVASVVVAVWYWTGSSTGFALHSRVIACLFFGVLVLIADVVVYNSYLGKIRDARIKERNKKETKKVVRKIVI